MGLSSKRVSRRQSLVSILIKSTDNTSLRILNDEIKKIHKQQINTLETQHQSEMELLADLVTYIKVRVDNK